MTNNRYIWIARGTWAPLDQIAADPQLRAEALANAKRSRARRKYLQLVEAFAEHDGQSGAVPLIERAAADAPPKRVVIRDGSRCRAGYLDPVTGTVKFGPLRDPLTGEPASKFVRTRSVGAGGHRALNRHPALADTPRFLSCTRNTRGGRMTIFKIPVHPAAAVFPMLNESELSELADDIKANGLQQPLVVAEYEDEEHLIDGRNRREACRIAGVEPQAVSLDDGIDLVAYIISTNIHRRHMTKGQRAMVVAKIYPEPAKGGRGKKSSSNLAETAGFSQRRLNEARFVLRYASELSDNVLAGSVSLTAAVADGVI